MPNLRNELLIQDPFIIRSKNASSLTTDNSDSAWDEINGAAGGLKRRIYFNQIVPCVISSRPPSPRLVNDAANASSSVDTRFIITSSLSTIQTAAKSQETLVFKTPQLIDQPITTTASSMTTTTTTYEIRPSQQPQPQQRTSMDATAKPTENGGGGGFSLKKRRSHQKDTPTTSEPTPTVNKMAADQQTTNQIGQTNNNNNNNRNSEQQQQPTGYVKRYLNILKSPRKPSHKTIEIQNLQKQLRNISDELNETKNELVNYKRKLEEKETQLAQHRFIRMIASGGGGGSGNSKNRHHPTNPRINRIAISDDLRARLARFEGLSTPIAGESLLRRRQNTYGSHTLDRDVAMTSTNRQRSVGTTTGTSSMCSLGPSDEISRTGGLRSESVPSFADESPKTQALIDKLKRHSIGVDNNNDNVGFQRSDSALSRSEGIEYELRSCRFLLERQQAELQQMQDSIKDTTSAVKKSCSVATQASSSSSSSSSSPQSITDRTNIHNELLELRSRNETLSSNLKSTQNSLDLIKKQNEKREAEWENEQREYRNTLSVLEKELEEVIKEKAHAQVMWVELRDEKKLIERRNAELIRAYDSEINELKRKCSDLENECKEVKDKLDAATEKYSRDADEWKDFQKDLQIAVRVANDLKTEAEEKVQRLEAFVERMRINPKDTQFDSISESVGDSTIINNKNDDNTEEEEPHPPAPPAVANPKFNVVAAKRKETQSSVMNVYRQRRSNTDIILGSRAPIKEMIRRLEKASIAEDATVESSDDKSFRVNRLRSSSRQPPSFGGSGCTTTDDVKATITRSQSMKQNRSPPWQSRQRKISAERQRAFEQLLKHYPHNGCRRNALLEWCRDRLHRHHKSIDITNFSSSWSDGSALLALLHSYVPHRIADGLIESSNVRKKLEVGFDVAKKEGIPSTLKIEDMMNSERPQWEPIMDYVTDIYYRFEVTDNEKVPNSVDL